ncbi:MAG: c-type cytochrome [Burkholderiales bacterium]|nr:c-type cytochrome [Burkholderiales bacterium]
MKHHFFGTKLVAALALGMALATQALAEDAQTIVTTVCAACHGADGNSMIPMFPKIAGLQESYIVKQLRDFQTGRRKSDIMAPVVAALKPEDMAPLAAYFSQQKMTTGEAVEKKLTGIGKLVFFDGNEETGVPACVGCHRPVGEGFQIYPRIGGQHAQYVAQQLKNFASAERTNDVSRFMRVVAKRMSEEEIQSVADYLVSLGSK